MRTRVYNILQGSSMTAGLVLVCELAGCGVNPYPVSTWRANRWPRIDAHTHLQQDTPFILPVLDAVNVRRVVTLAHRGMDNPAERVAFERQIRAVRDAHRDRLVYVATFDVSEIDAPEYGARIRRNVTRSIAAGAAAIKVWKVLGMRARDASGRLLAVDDSRLDPIWRHLATLRMPVIMHTADPIDAFRPLARGSAHFDYFARHSQWHVYGRPDVYSHAQLMEQRDTLLARHRDLTVIATHLGSLEHDLPALADRLARYPNLYVDTAGRFVDLVRIPTASVRRFFIEHQDRVLFGSDWSTRSNSTPLDPATLRETTNEHVAAYTAQFRYLETDEEVTIGGITTRGLKLPDEVLRKIYWENAKRLIPGL